MSDQEPPPREEAAADPLPHEPAVATKTQPHNETPANAPTEIQNTGAATMCESGHEAKRHTADTASPIRVLAVGLLYPAVLGAALAWYIQAIVPFYASRVYGAASAKPSAWTLIAGLWFVVYHSAWYVARNAARRKDSPWPPEGRYRCRSFGSDVSDVGALLIAFIALDLVSGAYRPPLMWLVYGAMFLASLAAAIMRGSKLTWVALLASASGSVLHLCAANLATSIDWVILGIMWTLLIVYIMSRLVGVRRPYIDTLVQTELWGPEGTWKKSETT